jgi:hypothetical protein
MKTYRTALLRLAAAAAVLATSGTANAVLLDHGPSDPTLLFPTWYRDLNNVPLQLCRSTAPSPNALAALAPMCFPLAADPAGFPGNVGGELFYQDVAQKLTGTNGFKISYVAALEAAYVNATPIHGDEMVFARIRAFITPGVSGTYTVTHPYGVEVFPDLTAGQILRFTADVGLTPGDFNAALAGRIGPFLQWDVLNVGESLTNSAGEVFVGDPNFPHTYTGSPFLTNFIRVDGPPGSNLDGLGNDFLIDTTANILGQKYTKAIPQPLTVKRATYSRTPGGRNTVDVWVSSTASQKIILTAQDMPSLQMTGDGLGNYFSHIEYPAAVVQPNFVTVTNMTDNPPTQKTAGLVDLVNVTGATFDTLTRVVHVTATSSDLSVPPPALAVLGPIGGAMTAGAYTSLPLAATAVPPMKVDVASTAGGSSAADVVILPGLPMNPAVTPVVVSDAFAVAAGTTSALAVGANDPSAGTLLIIAPPASGTAIVAAAGVINYTPATNFVGPDSLQYVVQDATGAVSNVATVAITVAFTALPPTANGDQVAQQVNTAKTINVLANDSAATGTSLNPASVVITAAPASGTATANLDGTITYRAGAATGIVSFSYAVSNNFGQASTPATVSVLVEGGAEVVSFTKVNYTVSKAKWTITGGTTWFNTAFTQMTVTCNLNVGGVPGPVIGTAPIDPLTGKFQVVPVTGPTPTNPASITCITSNGGRGAAPVIFN